jgi:hypothetical protein
MDKIWQATTGRQRRYQRRTLRENIATPASVAVIEDLIAEARNNEVADVKLPDSLPVTEQASIEEGQMAEHSRKTEDIRRVIDADKRRLPMPTGVCASLFAESF